MTTDDLQAARPDHSNGAGRNGSADGYGLLDRFATRESELRERRPLILLADDDDLVRSVVRLTLEDREYQFLEAATGLEALELCRRHLPDLAILDWRMPGVTGIEVIERLRAEEGTMEIPTILLTANGMPTQIRQGRQAGARAFLVKPFSPLELVRTVEEVVAD